MIKATLQRMEPTSRYTVGMLSAGALAPLYTMEPPWRDNEKGRSCIPAGAYNCVMRRSPRFGWRYWVQDVPNRTWILIHPGNTVRHTLGCILPGRRLAHLDGRRAVLVSRPAVRALEEYMGGLPFRLVVQDFVGPIQ